ncbi:MAG TPA: CvpA family protein [Pirellulales bacterium]|nr:CvpA family protein [Pirellulales bacterium]
MLNLIILAIFAICVAFIFNEGMWGACLMFCNTLMAAVLASNLFEPVANRLEGMWPGLTYFCDFIAVWLVFVVSLVVFRLSTDLFSRHRMRFKKVVDVTGGVIFAIGVGWIMVQFTLFTMHLAPLERNFLGFQESPETRMFFGLGPDRNWLAFMHEISSGSALSRTPSPGDPDAHVFDPRGDFILRYGQRRKDFEAQTSLSVGP